MTKRMVLAAILGGVAMYVWTSLAHVALPLGEAGVSQIANNENAVLSAMHTALGGAPGLYLFPSMGKEPDAMDQYNKKLAANPSGMLIYHPPGRQAMTAGQLVTEFVSELIQVLLTVWLLAQTRLERFSSTVAFITVVGIVAAMATNVSYWNWFGFPGVYTVSYMTITFVGFLIAGAVVAALLRRGQSLTSRATA
jgi:hypothetical protein